jgi:hypothetical protein
MESAAHPIRPIRRAVGSLLSGMPELDGERAQLITTSEFSEYAKSCDLQRIFVQEYASGFALFAERKSSKKLYVLSTPNNLIRNWASLNSLLMFLHRHESPIVEFMVRLNKPNPKESH